MYPNDLYITWNSCVLKIKICINSLGVLWHEMTDEHYRQSFLVFAKWSPKVSFCPVVIFCPLMSIEYNGKLILMSNGINQRVQTGVPSKGSFHLRKQSISVFFITRATNTYSLMCLFSYYIKSYFPFTLSQPFLHPLLSPVTASATSIVPPNLLGDLVTESLYEALSACFPSEVMAHSQICDFHYR